MFQGQKKIEFTGVSALCKIARGTAHMSLPYSVPRKKYRLICLLANKTDEKIKGPGSKNVYFSKLPHSAILKAC